MSEPLFDPQTLTHANVAPGPCRGGFADGFAPVAAAFAAHFSNGRLSGEAREIGAGLTIYHRGKCVVDLQGGYADVTKRTLWRPDTRLVIFSATKGLAAMALSWLAEQGKLEWDAPVATYWPGFGQAGKEALTVRTLVNHQGGLCALDEKLSLADCVEPARYAHLVEVIERQKPRWEPGKDQGYHATTFGFYVRELFERIAGESLGTVLQRELFGPLGADVSLGTPAAFDDRIATLYAPPKSTRSSAVRSSTRPASKPRTGIESPPVAPSSRQPRQPPAPTGSREPICRSRWVARSGESVT
jgi:CubicO group peptidase (beta-lactamase class C family)